MTHPYFNTDAHGQRLLETPDTPVNVHEIAGTFDALATAISRHMEAQGFWDDEDNILAAIHGKTDEETLFLRRTALSWKNAQKRELMASELIEVMEGDRNRKTDDPVMSDKIPEFTCEEEEFADLMVRVLDFCGRRKLRIGAAFIAKLDYNANRPYRHGKKF